MLGRELHVERARSLEALHCVLPSHDVFRKKLVVAVGRPQPLAHRRFGRTDKLRRVDAGWRTGAPRREKARPRQGAHSVYRHVRSFWATKTSFMIRPLLVSVALAVVTGCATAPQRVERPPLADITWPDDSRATQLLVLNRVGFGANAASLRAIESLG